MKKEPTQKGHPMSDNPSENVTVTNVTDALPTAKQSRSLSTRFATAAASAGALALLVDAGYRRLRRGKNVEVVTTTVDPAPESNGASTQL
jgi:hypothetical protein